MTEMIAPIVEAVVDIECRFREGFLIGDISGAAQRELQAEYPVFQQPLARTISFNVPAREEVTAHGTTEIQALQFKTATAEQIVQIRPSGYSFNRLAPYLSLDEYLPEIERTWMLFTKITEAIEVKAVRLQYINRLLLPLVGGGLNFDAYLRVSPHLPDESGLVFKGFLNQHIAVEPETQTEARIVLLTQAAEGERLPVIFDITVGRGESIQPNDWTAIHARIDALRRLKNRIFTNTLTPSWLRTYTEIDE